MGAKVTEPELHEKIRKILKAVSEIFGPDEWTDKGNY